MVNVGRAGAASLDVIQEVEYVKQEAKIVYLLECLQKTSPPVSIVHTCTCVYARKYCTQVFDDQMMIFVVYVKVFALKVGEIVGHCVAIDHKIVITKNEQGYRDASAKKPKKQGADVTPFSKTETVTYDKSYPIPTSFMM